MSQNTALIQNESRDLDPNVRQRRASDPDKSVWVGASAGTGKTKVLTDRVLRLLLPRQNGQNGTAPHRILCLTFTKAAASEMLQRINNTLSDWATWPEEKLHEKLKDLMGYGPSAKDMEEARRLFAAVVDTPGGLKVMTIHSFCQSVLGRFPIEAGLPPHFTVIDESLAQDLLNRARDRVLEAARQNPESETGLAVKHLAAWQNEDQFMHLLRGLSGERKQLAQLPPLAEIKALLCGLFGVAPGDNAQNTIEAACSDDGFDKAALYECARGLAAGTKTDQERGHLLQLWLDSPPQDRAATLESYKNIFLTAKGEPRAKMATNSAVEACPDITSHMTAEALRLMALNDKIKALTCIRLTVDLLFIGKQIIDYYQNYKDQRAQLDYDDLILKTLALLQKQDIAPWVMFKLDGGLDHILVDEAQDTNPEQWEVILKLTEEFYTGSGSREDVTRTSFTVGDEKQSIYSFQRASPSEFERIRKLFVESGNAEEENLNISFRSVETVLNLVDETFHPDHLREGLSRTDVEHVSFRKGQAGLVELWPLIGPDKTEEEEAWSPPVKISEVRSGQAKLAEKIGDTIKGWIDSEEEIPSLGRAVTAGDIMVLVRTRTAFVNQLVRALKTRNVPVSGIDRMVLGEQIAVMDLLALAQFALLPDDDLTLACVLKSPLIGLTEEQLYDVAIDRKGGLWRALRESDWKAETEYLNDLINHAAADHPFEFFDRILQRPCPADKVSGLRAIRKRLGDDALDPLDEFLNAALSYEQDHIPTLQGFLVWQQQGDITIKRELEEAGQAVRIMTVHGSKGLQAPVVIMPDTTRTGSSKKIDNLLWPDKTGLPVPLWAPRSDDFPDIYKQARGRLEQALDEEYRRLLYVALTRAEDRLYIAGCHGKNKPMDDCWYYYISEAMDRMEGLITEEDGTKRIKRAQTADADRIKDKKDSGDDKEITLPAWLTTPAPEEPSPPQPLIPSRPSEQEPAMRSPLAKQEEYRFKRGNITHTLLQILPDLPPEERRAAAENYVRKPGHNISTKVQDGIITETMRILEDPDYAPLFGEGSLAEVPITGLMGGKLISAQIDRLLVTDDHIMIIDYKTNRPPPRDEKKVPDIYRSQLRAYRDIISAIYPNRAIRCFLLWTDTADLMELTAL